MLGRVIAEAVSGLAFDLSLLFASIGILAGKADDRLFSIPSLTSLKALIRIPRRAAESRTFVVLRGRGSMIEDAVFAWVAESGCVSF